MKQNFEAYTLEDLDVWKTLFHRQVKHLKTRACSDYLIALNKMKEVLNAEELPNFEKINHWFRQYTGWEIVCVPGLIPVNEFFEFLAQKKFPSSTWLREKSKLDYLEEPDMFHDIFGHIPLLCQTEYSEFMLHFGALGTKYINNEKIMKELQRLYWFTIEFGLIEENDTLRILGAGIASSFNESSTSLESHEVNRHAFDLESILQTDFTTSEIQSQYFIVQDLAQLEDSIHTLTKKYHDELEVIIEQI